MKIFAGYIRFALPLLVLVQAPGFREYTIDSSRSRLEIEVFRGGILKSFGHNHTISAGMFSGKVRLNPEKLTESSVSLTIDADSLVVLDPDASEKERGDVQTTMKSPRVLDPMAFPRITFISTQVRKTAQVENGLEIRLTGRLNLHGTEKEISLPVRLTFERDLLHVTGTTFINQTDFGINPIKLAGGTVRVKDQVKLNFDLQARRAETQ